MCLNITEENIQLKRGDIKDYQNIAKSEPNIDWENSYSEAAFAVTNNQHFDFSAQSSPEDNERDHEIF